MAGPRPTVLVAFLTLVILAGVNFVAVRISNETLPPTWGAAFRFLIAAWLLWIIVVWRRIPVPSGRALVGAVLYGALMFGGFFGFIYWGLVEVPAPTGAVIASTVPLLTIVAAAVAGIERVRSRAVLGAVVVIVGTIVLIGSPSTVGSPVRLAAVFVAAGCAAAATVVVKRFPASDPFATNAIGMAAASILLGIASLAQGETWNLPDTSRTQIAVAYLVFSSLALFPLLVWVIQQWTASASSYIMVLAPLVTTPVAVVFLDATFDGRFFLAAAIMLVGVYIGALRRPQPSTAAPSEPPVIKPG